MFRCCDLDLDWVVGRNRCLLFWAALLSGFASSPFSSSSLIPLLRGSYSGASKSMDSPCFSVPEEDLVVGLRVKEGTRETSMFCRLLVFGIVEEPFGVELPEGADGGCFS